MARTNQFQLTTRWQVTGTIQDVADILTAPERFPDWWGDVYLDTSIVDPGDERGIGRKVAVHSRGYLPYHLHWTGTLVAQDLPYSWEIRAEGDLTGRGLWTLTQAGDQAQVVYDWTVSADRLLFRLLAPLFKPLMVSNHNWAMAKGLAGLQSELARIARSR